MSHNQAAEAIFLDTQAFEAASLNFKTPTFAALRKHLESGRLKLVTTDITIREVHARIEKNARKELTAHDKFREAARIIRSSSRDEVHAALVELNAEDIIAGHRSPRGESWRGICANSRSKHSRAAWRARTRTRMRTLSFTPPASVSSGDRGGSVGPSRGNRAAMITLRGPRCDDGAESGC
jgi:hypothetical protein